MNFLHKIYDIIERKLLIGNSSLQWLFEGMHRISLRGMNYEQVQSIEKSGELFVVNYINKHTIDKSKLTFFDVGANVGSYSLLLCKEFPCSKIYSFEPSSLTYQILERNLNSYPNVTCLNIALGSKAERRPFYFDRAGSPLASFYPGESLATFVSKDQIVVSVLDIDTFCDKNNILHIDLLKIDVEGFESEVLTGASRMLSEKRIKFIQFEFGEAHIASGTRLKDLFEILSDYKISRVLKNGLREYKKYDKVWEIYHTANYFAELKTTQ